ncbi:unnamed protein product [Arctia plantaginis]|uniref:Uncharacterized protein n=1 Tax=Arctia plantaginis TaxID=874455 RepID=A0A8S1BRT0_ARCPL|nr:unnamed protein product [Arctia plantaginis]
MVEKRKERDEEGSAEDDFITIVRRRPKRMLRSEALEVQNNMRVDEENNEETQINVNHEVCVSTLNSLPKQVALAKLLQSENILNVLRIKYKSQNKVLIQFKTKEDAGKLINCQKVKEMGCQAYLIHEISNSYGVVKGIESDLNEEELKEILQGALLLLTKRKQTENKQKGEDNSYTQPITTSLNPQETYSSVLARAVAGSLPQSTDEEENNLEANTTGKKIISNHKVNKRKMSNKNKKREYLTQQPVDEERDSSMNDEDSKTQNSEKAYKLEFMKVWSKIKSIIMSQSKLEEKILYVLKIIFEEMKKLICSKILGRAILEHISSFMYG